MKLLILSFSFGFAMFVAAVLIVSPTDTFARENAVIKKSLTTEFSISSPTDTFAREKGNSTQSFCMAAQSDHLMIGEEMTGALADLCK